MADGGTNPEIDLGLGKVSEVTKEQVEQFQEQLRQAQAALAALQKEESKAKKKDTTLAGVLSQFLQSNKDLDVLQLVVKCLEMNIPVDIIMGILSIAYVKIYNALAEELKHLPLPEEDENFMEKVEEEEQKDIGTAKQMFDTQNLPPEIKAKISEWVKDMIILAMQHKVKILETMYHEDMIKKSPLLLSMLVMKRYLDGVNIESEEEKLRNFVAFVMNGIGKELGK